MNNRIGFLAGFILMACLAALLSGQSATGQIFGNVKNVNGDDFPGVTVTATHGGIR